MLIIYHYFPTFRKDIFDALRCTYSFDLSYGINGRRNIATLVDPDDLVHRNFYFMNFILQTMSWPLIKKICKNDVVILGDVYFVNAWLYAILAKIFGRKVYFWTHGLLREEKGVKLLVRKVFYSLATEFFVYHEAAKTLMQRSGFIQPITVIGNSNYSINSNLFSDTVTEKNFCYVGRLKGQKDIEFLIELSLKVPTEKVLVVGPRPSKLRLPSNVSNLTFSDPEYDIFKIQELLGNYGKFIVTNECGLAGFTAILLYKKLYVRQFENQKPEYHILNNHGLVNEFTCLDDILAQDCDIDETAYRNFLTENSAEAVARRIYSRVKLSEC